MQFHLTQEQVPQEIQWLSELVGMEHFLQILDTAGGEWIFFSKRGNLGSTLRHQAILREYNGSNLRQLSRKYGVTDRCIRNILKEGQRPS